MSMVIVSTSSVVMRRRWPCTRASASPIAGGWMPSALPIPMVAVASFTHSTGARSAMTGRSPKSRPDRSSKGEIP
jgi:hypothetical protein